MNGTSHIAKFNTYPFALSPVEGLRRVFTQSGECEASQKISPSGRNDNNFELRDLGVLGARKYPKPFVFLKVALEGRIITAAYQGAVVEYEVSAAGTIVKVRVANSTGQTLYQRGDEIRLSFTPEAVTCLVGSSGK